MAVLRTANDRERWVSYLAMQPLPQEVGCAPWRAPRTNAANSYLWAAAYPPLVAACGFSALEWHEHFCGEFWGMVERAKPNGSVELIPKRTTTRVWKDGKYVGSVCKKDEFARFTAFVESEIASRGVYVEQERPQ